MPDDPRHVPADTLPTVVLEHARTGQPVVVDLRDYLAGRDGRYADWRLLGQGGFIDPPGLKSEGGPPDPAGPEPPDEEAAPAPPPSTPSSPRRRRRKHRRSRP
ncbi:hypothetical protein GCM10017083_07050 [Thalassobaculum fulvum]|uniref:Uncharacterized protein n=1 Tax=Thalassobaculum fulvum TaxID=1633335 RepID=A0A918XPZ4_9PROT|nr:hypothetical protein [Thalassobaculum fulvum]GHD42252.1 hypothetical protein GCM10017083_07050 [Thalassobaculum fulvum]